MIAATPTFWRCYLPLVGVGFGAAAVVAGIGCAAGRFDVGAILAGCAASWAASCIGAAPTALALAANPRNIAMAVLTSTALRFVVVLMLVVPLVLSGWFAKAMLVVFVAVSYLMILLLESVMTVAIVRRCPGSTSE
jgi:hypothetical protein